ncbi:MAG: ABC transporter permease [Thermoleophilaceae bacterium]|nr:ABC transporter permease [Thermoleophilaceae bacterium]
MRWLLLKDLRILRRSPLLAALLVIYPIAIALLIGFAVSRGPDRPRVAILNELPASARTLSLGGEDVDVARYTRRLFEAVDPVTVRTRAEALDKVRSGDVLAALIVPPDVTRKLETGLEPATVQVLYNAEDPVKARYVQDTIKAQVQDASNALTRKLTQVALGYLKLISSGGRVSLLGRDVDVLGLERAERIVRAARRELPRASASRERLDRVERFAALARDNLSLSDDVLASVASPIRVDRKVIHGGATPLSSFAVPVALTFSLMFVTVLLAAGALALEREENAFPRLVRGLVPRSGLLAEKVGLAAICALVLALVMLAALSAFVDLGWGRFPLWIAAIALGALGFAAMGAAIGGLAREVRAASLLGVMLSLPVAFLALVPSGAVSGGAYDAIRVVSAAFPFRPTLSALDAALNRSGPIGPPLLHLAVLTLAFGAIARLSLVRFAR